jgi:transposase InsO family protein
LAFAIDTYDREVMACVATTGGISGEMIRDLVERIRSTPCVEQRFAAL